MATKTTGLLRLAKVTIATAKFPEGGKVVANVVMHDRFSEIPQQLLDFAPKGTKSNATMRRLCRLAVKTDTTQTFRLRNLLFTIEPA